jgi:hypothetical protein
MKGALGLNTPTDLFKKFCYELDRLKTDHNDIYAALNAVRDAYHLREWIWHSWIESGLIQLRDFPNPKGNPEQNWNIWSPYPAKACSGDVLFGEVALR